MKRAVLAMLAACGRDAPTYEPPPHKHAGEPRPPARAPAPPAYEANRATRVLEEHQLATPPQDPQAAWGGEYDGSLAIHGSVEGTMGYHFVVHELTDAIVVEEPGVLSCRALRAPKNPNVAACRGGYIGGSYELAVAHHGDGRLAIALVTGDGTVPGHPEITVPGNTIFGTLLREKPR